MAGNGGGPARGRGGTPASRRSPASGSGTGAPRIVARNSPAVYRRRRLAVLVLAVLVLALLAGTGFWVASLFGPDRPAAAVPEPGPGTAPPAQPAPGASTGPASACPESQVVLRASTDQQAYGPGSNPLLIMEVANEGDFPCELNVGTDAMEFVVTSGEDRIFSSKDCEVDPGELLLTIEPGKSERAQFTWQRNRSAPGCTPVEANPQPGTYVLVTKLDERTSNKAVFELR
ncbi:hypothetical protein [Arthrobacter mobilis]|uniref:DUF4232 domain-containing protein n=1 Tax=Arthrobacter mobilis TaxID=2724944 RepID=A0A7X6HDD1_9MICC|nr:hypothetical protein [Arthrobacter mobilis]NKX55076.1 hypothetical protein [Arthrobacter mobilis]